MNTENPERRRSTRREANRLKKLAKKKGNQGTAMDICFEEESKVDDLNLGKQ